MAEIIILFTPLRHLFYSNRYLTFWYVCFISIADQLPYISILCLLITLRYLPQSTRITGSINPDIATNMYSRMSVFILFTSPPFLQGHNTDEREDQTVRSLVSRILRTTDVFKMSLLLMVVVGFRYIPHSSHRVGYSP